MVSLLLGLLGTSSGDVLPPFVHDDVIDNIMLFERNMGIIDRIAISPKVMRE